MYGFNLLRTTIDDTEATTKHNSNWPPLAVVYKWHMEYHHFNEIAYVPSSDDWHTLNNKSGWRAGSSRFAYTEVTSRKAFMHGFVSLRLIDTLVNTLPTILLLIYSWEMLIFWSSFGPRHHKTLQVKFAVFLVFSVSKHVYIKMVVRLYIWRRMKLIYIHVLSALLT
jgi:hypothetical protein